MTVKRIKREDVDELISSSQYLAYYVNLSDMDLCQIQDYQSATNDLLEILGNMFEFDPYEEEDYDEIDEEEEDE